MWGLEGVLAGLGIEHVGLTLTLVALGYHSRKVSKVGSMIGGAMSTAALFAVLLALFLATGMLNPDLSSAVAISEKAYSVFSRIVINS